VLCVKEHILLGEITPARTTHQILPHPLRMLIFRACDMQGSGGAEESPLGEAGDEEGPQTRGEYR